jgi:cytochrome c553
LAAVLFAVGFVTTSGAASGQQMTLQERLEMCAACHGADGNSKMEKIPSLAGQPEFFLLNQLVLMREGVRRIEVMEAAVKGLQDAEIQVIAAHFAKLDAQPTGEAIRPELAARGAVLSARMKCGSCHLPSMAGQEQMPRLAKQRIDYMLDAMKGYRDNTRSGADTTMAPVVYGVSDADLEALAHYVASR